MTNWPEDPIGAAWLAVTCHVDSLLTLPVVSRICCRRATHDDHSRRSETYVEAMRPDASIAAVRAVFAEEPVKDEVVGRYPGSR